MGCSGVAQTRRTARTLQLNTGAAAMRTRYGPGVSIPTDNGAEIEALDGSVPSFAAWEQNVPYTIALLIKGRSGGASTKHLYRSGTSSTADHILWLSSGTTPNLRHQASGGGTVTITSSVAIVNDTTWSTIVETWRPGRLELYLDGISRANSTAANTNTSDAFGIYRWGWGFSTNQDFNGGFVVLHLSLHVLPVELLAGQLRQLLEHDLVLLIHLHRWGGARALR
jgi:hypothetical protein